MFFYRVILQHGALGPEDYSHHATLAEAHAAAKGYDKVNERPHVRIEMIHVDTSKDGVLALLQGYSIQSGSVSGLNVPVRVMRAWELSARGGLAELSEAEVRELGIELYNDGDEE